MDGFTRDAALDNELFEIFARSRPTAEDLVRARQLAVLIFAQDHTHLLKVISRRCGKDELTPEQVREVAGRLGQQLMKQVLHQLGGGQDGLILSRDESESVFKWECAKLGRPYSKDPRKRGMLSNFLREVNRRSEVQLEESHVPKVAEQLNLTYRRRQIRKILDVCSEYPSVDGWILELWVHSKMNGLTTRRVLEIASRHGVKQPYKSASRRALSNAARSHGLPRPDPDNLPVSDLTYEQLAELASTSARVSRSKVEKTVGAFKKRIRSLLGGSE